MNTCKYSLLLLYPSRDRLDLVVAGAVFFVDSRWDIRVAANVIKMTAIEPDFSTDRLGKVLSLLKAVSAAAKSFQELQTIVASLRLGLVVHPSCESFSYDGVNEYHRQVDAVLSESVNVFRPRVNPASSSRRPTNKVRRDLRSRFQHLGIWSKKSSDIFNHRVIEQYLLSEEHGVVAEFALKNGAMHVTETIDFEAHTVTSKRREAQAKALVLDESSRIFGGNTKKYVVISGVPQSDMRPSLKLLEDRAKVFALESDEDMDSYMSIIYSAIQSNSDLA